MKIIVSITLCYVLSGCYQTIDLFDIEAAKVVCSEQNSKVLKVNERFDGYTTVDCTDGTGYKGIDILSNELKLKTMEKLQ